MRTNGRITILGLNYAPEPTGNAPYTTGLARHLADRGADVTALVGFPHYPQWKRQREFPGWHTVTQDQGVHLKRLWHWIPRPPRGLRRLVSELTFGMHALVTRWGHPDSVILVSPALFSTWCAMLRLLVQRSAQRVMWVQDSYSQGMEETAEGGRIAASVVRRIEGWTLRRAHVVVAIHETMAERMIERLGVARERVIVIPNWSHVRPTTLNAVQARHELGWAQEFTVVHAGNIGLKQGLDVLIDAAREVERLDLPIRIVLLGDGSERQRLEQRAHGLARVEFVDPLSDELFPVAIAAANALVVTELPGVAEMAMPSKLTTYFASLRPVVASVEPHGIVARVLRETGAGRLVPAGDAAALVQALSELASDTGVGADYGRRALQYWATNLDPGRALGVWERVLEATTLGSDQKGAAND